METGAAQYFDEAARWLKADKVHVEPGLNDTEVDAIEGRYEFRFPPDLRMFLQTVVPISAPKSKRVWFYMSRMKPRRGRMRPIAWSLPNWRKPNRELDDMVTKSFDLATWYGDQQIERGQWDERWGIKPDDLQEAKRQMVESVRRAPRTIPLSNAFYMSADPSEPGNPIWEYFIEDLQYYAGFDLPGFLHNRYGVPLPSWAAVVPRWIDFWSEEIHMSPERTSREAYDRFVRYFLDDPDPAAARERFFRGQPDGWIPEGDEPPEWADRYGHLPPIDLEEWPPSDSV